MAKCKLLLSVKMFYKTKVYIYLSKLRRLIKAIKNQNRWMRLVVSISALIAMCLYAPTSLYATSYYWNVNPATTNATWDLNTNWTPVTGPPSDPTDTSGDFAYVINGGTANLVLPGVGIYRLYVGLDGSSSTLNVTGPGTLQQHYAALGSGTTGTMNVTGGAIITTLDSYRWVPRPEPPYDLVWTNDATFTIGTNGTNPLVAGYGVLNVRDAGTTVSLINLRVGDTGGSTGVMNILNGGAVTTTGASYVGRYVATGTVNVSDNGSRWTTQESLYIGHEGTGELNISNRGLVTSTARAVLGNNATGIGTANVSGSGSEWKTQDTLFVGNNGTGELNILNSGLVTSAKHASIGYEATGTGTVNVNNANWIAQQELRVGYYGTGELNISNLGVVTTTGSAIIGFYASGAGTVNVSDNGSKWNTNGNLFVGNFGTAELNIFDQGLVTSTGNASIGYESTAIGTVNVRGAGSEWKTQGTELRVGYSGIGELNISNQGLVTSTGTTSYVGRQTGSTGTVNVSDAGSVWDTRALNVGNNGRGTMNILDGGVVNSTAASGVGTGANGRGWVNIIGKDGTTNSAWNLGTNVLTVAGQGYGRVEVFNEGKLNSQTYIVIGGDATATASRGWIDVSKGIVRATDMRGGVGATGKFNILATGSDILFSAGYNGNNVTTSRLNTWFYSDSTGVGTSKINVATGAASGSVKLALGTYNFAAYGFAAQKTTNTFDLFTAPTASYTGTLNARNMKVVSDYVGTGTLTVAFNESDMRVWDLAHERFHFSNSTDKYTGWVLLDGEVMMNIIARFNLGTSSPDYELARTLQNYLSNGMQGSGSDFHYYGFGILDDGHYYVDFCLPTEFMSDGTYNILGWGLDHFNDYYGTDVSLVFLAHVPEPATWTLMLLGAAGLVAFRRRKK